MNFSRKSFLKLAGLGAGAIVSSPLSVQGALFFKQKPKDFELKLGVASYSLRGYNLKDSLAITNRVGVKDIAFKSMHMPMDSSEAEIQTILEEVAEAGLNLYGVGVVGMKTEEEVENAFRYASAAKVKVIIGVPNPDLLTLVEKKVKETNIKLAIHNHGPGDKLYPSPKSIYEKVKSLDKRMGLCIDIGHTIRIGEDPIADIKKYADRLFDIHLKDVDIATPEGDTTELGRGVIDIPGVFQALNEIEYTGIVALEYEKNENDVIPGLAESMGYARGVLAGLK